MWRPCCSKRITATSTNAWLISQSSNGDANQPQMVVEAAKLPSFGRIGSLRTFSEPVDAIRGRHGSLAQLRLQIWIVNFTSRMTARMMSATSLTMTKHEFLSARSFHCVDFLHTPFLPLGPTIPVTPNSLSYVSFVIRTMANCDSDFAGLQ